MKLTQLRQIAKQELSNSTVFCRDGKWIIRVKASVCHCDLAEASIRAFQQRHHLPGTVETKDAAIKKWGCSYANGKFVELVLNSSENRCSSQTQYRVLKSGAIVDAYGGLLYDSESLEGFSPAAQKRLAQLHTQDPDLTWEGSETQQGAWSILKAEGYSV